MLIATFGPTTGWAGKTIAREGDIFILQDHGPISASDVMEYDRQGHLVWADDGTRAWVAWQASQTPKATPSLTASAAPKADRAAGAGVLGNAGPRQPYVQPVGIKRVSTGDWVVLGGFVAMFLGASLPWYTSNGVVLGVDVGWSDAGWVSITCLLSMIVGLAAVVVAILASGVFPQLHIDFRGRAPWVILALGGAATLLVLLGTVVKPTDITGLGVGLLMSLLGAVAVGAGGVVKLTEPVPVVTPSKASAAVDNAMGSAKAAFSAARVAVASQKDVQNPAQAHATAVEQPAPSAENAPPAGVPATSVADEVVKLAELRSKGFITDEEFAALKAKLM